MTIPFTVTSDRIRAAQRLASLLIGLALGMTGCGDAVDPTTVDLDLTAYPPCAEQPDAPDLPDVAGLRVPPGTVVFSHTEVGPLTQASGVVALTPLQTREFYETHPELEVISIEDERIEAEILVTDGDHRMFVKVQIACAVGSNITATVGTEDVAGSLPRPAGQPAGQ